MLTDIGQNITETLVKSNNKDVIKSAQGEGTGKINRQERLIANTVNTNSAVAFYAYRSNPEQNVGDNHQLFFDVVKTNIGSGFHPSTGVFIVPESGLYVFAWSYRIAGNAYHTVQLSVNGVPEGALHGHVYGSDENQISGTIVIEVKKGDDVFLRTAGHLNNGVIYSDSYGYTYFAGWKIN